MHIEEIIEALKLSHKIATALYYENQTLRSRHGDGPTTSAYAWRDDLKKINDLVNKLTN